MEKTTIVILLLGTLLISYAPISQYFRDQNLEACSCKGIEDFIADAEGKRSCVYKDTEGIPTIGIG